MHETHLLKHLIEDLLKIAKEKNIKKITKIYLSIGQLTEITPANLVQNFGEHAKGTILENAEINITQSPTRELRLLSFDCE